MTWNDVNHVLPHALAQTGGSITGQTAAHQCLIGMASSMSLEAGLTLRPVTAGAGGRSSWPKGGTPHETAPLTAQPGISQRCTQLHGRGAALLQMPPQLMHLKVAVTSAWQGWYELACQQTWWFQCRVQGLSSRAVEGKLPLPQLSCRPQQHVAPAVTFSFLRG